ncbi:MAG: type II and III secretion system protein, partial [Chthoniobacterales bacterium]
MDRSHLNRLACVAIGCAIFTTTTALAQERAERTAQREVARREAALPQGNEALVRAKAAMAERNYTVAFEEYRTAVAYLPDAVVSGGAHDEAVGGFCKAGVKLAEAKIAAGKYGDAEAICREILSDRYDSNCRAAQELLAHLETPGYFNHTMGPKFIAKVEEVKTLLTDAEGFYKSGRYDLAMKRYEQVLNLDPYNVAARRGQEKIDNTKYHYGEEAYNETRARSMWQVEHGWENPVRNYSQGASAGVDTTQKELTGTARIANKLNTIIIPKIEFRDASIREAIDFIRQQAAANDPTSDGHRGVDIVLRLTAIGGRAPEPTTATVVQPIAPLPSAAGPTEVVAPVQQIAPPIAQPAAPVVPPGEARITITLNQIPLGEALRYIASQAGLKVKIEPYAVSIIPLSEMTNDLLTKQYRVPPGFIAGTLTPTGTALNQPATSAAKGVHNTGTGKDTQESTGGRLLVNREGAKEFL